MNCLYCKKKFKQNLEYNNHLKRCIFYLYNSNYSKNISDEVITNVLEIIIILDLHNKPLDYIFNKTNIIETIQLEYIINNTIILSTYNNQKIEYLYNYFKYNKLEIYNYKDIIDLISTLYHISYIDVINIINCYKISYNNSEF
jgi:hypothetical protein